MTSKITDMLPPDVDPNDTLYIVDKELNVVYTNEEWAKFASKNKGGRILDEGWNSNLLYNISGKEKQRWKHIYRLLLEGRIPQHKEDFICSSPVEKRIYQLRITPKKDDDVFFATGLIFRFDQRGQQLTCSNFGHHSPIFSRTGQIYIDRGPPVGLADEVQP